MIKPIAALTICTLTLTPVARADPFDDQFLSEISSQGITMDRDAAISQAHQACDLSRRVNYGQDQVAALQLVGLMNAIGRPIYPQFAHAAAQAYCPDAMP